ncbi:MAG: hypothetical protein M3Q08_16730 [Pseudomonadota bacterium]|nr:hypothetical protein [Pseudomonadota bacterium]
MPLRLSLIIAAALGITALGAAHGRPPHREHDAARQGLQQGRIRPLPVIEQMLIPQMRGFDYLGPEFDAGSARYRLKFIREGRVVWVDVDGRSGRVLGRSPY